MSPELVLKQTPKPKFGCLFTVLSASWLAVVGLAGYFLIVARS